MGQQPCHFTYVLVRGQRPREANLQGLASSECQSWYLSLGKQDSEPWEKGGGKSAESEKALNKLRQTRLGATSTHPFLCLPGTLNSTFVPSHISPSVYAFVLHLINTSLPPSSRNIITSASHLSLPLPMPPSLLEHTGGSWRLVEGSGSVGAH